MASQGGGEERGGAASLTARCDQMPNQRAGLLCLDFANTVEPRGGPSPYTPPPAARRGRRDTLTAYGDVVAWATVAGVLTLAEGGRLLDAAARRLVEAEAVFARAIALREALYRLFWRVAQGDEAAADDLALLRAEYARTSAGATLVRADGRYAWRWQLDLDAVDGLLWPVAWSAVELLTRGELDRVKVCPGVAANVPCAWLFYDESRNRARHWCSMEDGCGARAKAQRQNARRRAQ